MEEQKQRDYEAYVRLLDLWSKENPIKTTKLQVLLVVNGALFSVVHYAGGFVAENLSLFIAGGVLSFIWTLSIGRTVLFQKLWQIRLREIAARYPDDVRFQVTELEEARPRVPRWLRLVGGVSSKYYLLAAPFVFCVAWFVGAVYVFWRMH